MVARGRRGLSDTDDAPVMMVQRRLVGAPAAAAALLLLLLAAGRGRTLLAGHGQTESHDVTAAAIDPVRCPSQPRRSS